MPSLRARQLTRGFFLVILVAACAVAGCSPAIGNVAGKVTYQGKELKGGTVTLTSTQNGPNYGTEIGEDGSYSISNVRAGVYKVCVTTAHLKSENTGPMPPGGGGPKVAPSAPDLPPTASNPRIARENHNLKRYVSIPESYSNPETTELTYTVTGGDQQHNIELK
jgi:hypothetical protein